MTIPPPGRRLARFGFGGAAAGDIESAGDRAWFVATPEAGTVDTVDLENRPPATARCRTRIRTGFTTRAVSCPQVPETKAVARGATAARPSLPRRPARNCVAAGACGSDSGAAILLVTEDVM